MAMSEAMRSLLPTIDVFGMPMDLGWIVIPAMLLVVLTIA
ncbi:hypothetical protein GJR88_04557 [Dietzia sp. DQ12-45-1b]|nr:hypothetical protein GJR88_04557 [Dietzia sp. DQ12-45-1b]